MSDPLHIDIDHCELLRQLGVVLQHQKDHLKDDRYTNDNLYNLELNIRLSVIYTLLGTTAPLDVLKDGYHNAAIHHQLLQEVYVQKEIDRKILSHL